MEGGGGGEPEGGGGREGKRGREGWGGGGGREMCSEGESPNKDFDCQGSADKPFADKIHASPLQDEVRWHGNIDIAVSLGVFIDNLAQFGVFIDNGTPARRLGGAWSWHHENTRMATSTLFLPLTLI